MTWKKISDSGDLKIFEKSKRKLKIRIEARLTDKGWEIYKNYNDGRQNKLVEEYVVENESELLTLMESLKKEKDLTEKDIEVINKWQNKEHKFRFKRVYKGADVEKWKVVIEGIDNFVIVKFGDHLVIDVLLNEKFRFISEKFMNEVYNTIIDDDESEVMEENVYYFSKSFTHREEFPKNVYVNNVELNFNDL